MLTVFESGFANPSGRGAGTRTCGCDCLVGGVTPIFSPLYLKPYAPDFNSPGIIRPSFLSRTNEGSTLLIYGGVANFGL